MSDGTRESIEMFLPFIVFGIIAIVVVVITITQQSAIFNHNQQITLQIIQLKKKIRMDTLNVSEAEAGKDFLLKKMDVFDTELLKKLSNSMLSSELIKVEVVHRLNDTFTLILGKFVSTEIFTSKNHNYGVKKYYSLDVLMKIEDQKLSFYGEFPVDKNHDFLYRELFLKIESIITSPPPY